MAIALQTALLALTTILHFAAPAAAQQIAIEGRCDPTMLPSYDGGFLFTRFFDADGDGREDLAYGGDDFERSYLVVAIHRGNGAFDVVYHFSTTGLVFPNAICSGDLDGDGVRELVYSGQDGLIRILSLASTGLFVVSGEVQSWPAYIRMETGDLDGDGDTDLAGLNGDNTVRIHWNSNGALGPAVAYPSGPATSDLALADLDGDSDLDIVVANTVAPGSVSVLVNLGAGAFATPVSYAVGALPSEITVADFDGDGVLDVASVNSGSTLAGVLRGLGNGTFSAVVTSDIGTRCTTIAAADVDGDGAKDLVLTRGSFLIQNGGPSEVRVLRNVGGGAFAAPATFAAGFAITAGIDDLDSDGDLDIVLPRSSALRNRGDGSFGLDPEISPQQFSLIRRLTAGDLDSDGNEDLVVLHADGLRVRMNQGDGTFAPPSVIVPNLTSGEIRLVDLDADGDLDLLFQSAPLMPATPRAIMNQAGVLGPTVLFAQASSQAQLEVGDVDGDGRSDVAVRLGSTLQYFRHTGGATWAPIVPLVVMSGSGASALPDVDGDGDADFVTTQAGQLRVHLNQGGLVYAAPVVVATIPALRILAADFDGDGDDDLCVTTSSSTSVLRSLGNGAYASPVEIGRATDRIAAEDMDHDGDVDLLAMSGNLHVDVFENLGATTFAPAHSAGFSGSASLATVDLDHDGDEEVLGAVTLSTLTASKMFVLNNAARAGMPFCAGDGGGTACPCGNASALGAGLGCVSSTGRAGKLAASGSSSLRTDTLRLRGTGMTNSSALYFQGTASVANGAGSVFGDGLRCVAGTVIRLGVVTNSAGQSTFPAASQPPLRVLGQVTTPGTRMYQVWYRDAASFCTPSTWNLTNGLRIDWAL